MPKPPPSWLGDLSTVYDGESPRGRPLPDSEFDALVGHQHGPRASSTARKAAEYQRSNLVIQLREEFKAFFLDTKLNLLLCAFPFAIISKATGWGDGPTFVFSVITLCPLAERLGFVTEQLAMYTNDTLGGLLNATFGNATEVIISGFALRAGLIRVVQLSLLGSVVSNLLLVLGTAFIAGGIKRSCQRFNQQGSSVNSALLLLGTVAVLVPSLLSETRSEAKENTSELHLSRFISVFLLLLYICYLFFQLYTHRYLYEGGPDPKEQKEKMTPDAKSNIDLERGVGSSGAPVGRADTHSPIAVSSAVPEAHIPSLLGKSGSNRQMELTVRTGPSSRSGSGRPDAGPSNASGPETPRAEVLRSSLVGHEVVNGVGAGSHGPGGSPDGGQGEGEGDGDDDDEELVLSKVGCFIWMTAVTICISILSEWIVSAIEGASKALRMPMPFLTTILLPIVGNAAEHASAIVFAYKNKIEIALGVAVGSATQIAVLVVPFCVVLGWMMGQPLDLNFNAFEAAVYFFSVLLTIITLQDGTANWLKGALLLVTYCLVAAGFWMHKDYLLNKEDVDS